MNQSLNLSQSVSIPGGKLNVAGFSLIELMGVMAVTAILASVILPSVIKQLRIQAAENESAFLAEMGGALKTHLRRTRAFPDENTWSQAVADELGVPVAEVLETTQQSRRVFVIDPALRIGTVEGTLPFTQDGAGSIEPVSPRVMILSSLDGTKPIPLSDGIIAAEDFEALWDLPGGGVPPDWDSRWQLSGGDLKVERINLARVFHEVRLNNYDTVSPGYYSVDGTQAQVVPATGINAYYVEGTVLGLQDDGETLVSRQILHRPVAFTYERDSWRGQVFTGLSLSGDDIYNATTLLAASAQNPHAQAGANVSLVIDAFTDFMENYVKWDEANFPGANSQTFEGVSASRAELEAVTAQIVFSPQAQ